MLPTLTTHQATALQWIVTKLTKEEEPVVALRGLAGTGKTTLIPALVTALREHNIPVSLGAPTHRAAMILRSKGLDDATTVHSLALTPYFQPVYATAMDYLAPDIDYTGRPYSPCPTHEPYTPATYMNDAGVPLLLAEALPRSTHTLDDLCRIARRYPVRKALESVGIHGRRYFDGFGAKAGEGCLIIDEASMVGETLLTLCTQAFPQICLIGDPGQLPPVKDTPVLSQVPGVDLTEIHRQAADSPIVSLAYAARQGQAHWQAVPHHPGLVEEWLGVAAEAFLTAPLLVWRNTTRLTCTAAIRSALGYPPGQVVPGEPLQCRAQSPEDRADGYINNALYRVREVNPQDPKHVLIVEDGTDNEHLLQIHLEELHGEQCHPNAVPFRFAYCLTAHTAQGGEWPTVYIAKRDLLAYLGRCAKHGTPDEAAQWAYTAITRAKTTLGFLTQYDFTRNLSAHGGTAMPKMQAVEPEPKPALQDTALSETTPPPTDDIPDPAVPLQVMADLAAERLAEPTVDPATPAGQMVMTVDEALFKITQHAATVLASIDKSWDAALRVLNHNNNGLMCLKEAVQNYAPVTPYSATISTLTPSGFPMSFTVQHATQAGFLESMGGLLAFLKAQGFQPHDVAAIS